MNRFQIAAVAILLGVSTVAAQHLEANGAQLSDAEQAQLVGATGGDEADCTGTGNCTPCVAPSGCSPNLFGSCNASNCSTAGIAGCATEAAKAICNPTPGQSCEIDSTTSPCGNLQAPDATGVYVGGVWTCVGTCATGTPSEFCQDCK